MTHRIADIPEHDRPRERLLQHGAGALSDAELLAIFINTGTKGENAIQVAHRLMQEYGSLRDLSRLDPNYLAEATHALGKAKAATLAAAFELGRRAERELGRDLRVQSPEEVFKLLGAELQALNHESLRVILVNTRFNLIRHEEVFRGALNESLAHPREILRRAVIHAAYAFIVVHNHPSGDPSPSEADRQLTRRLREAGEVLKVPLADHVIIGTTSPSRQVPYFSFREAGLL